MYFQMWKSSSNNQWYWHLRAGNHEIIARGEGYINKADCHHAIGLVKATNTYTPVKEV